MLALKGLVGLHRTVQLQLLQHYWLGHRLGLLWYWMVCLGKEQRSFCHFWDCILFITEDWKAKVGSQGTPGVTGKFGLGIRNEAGQRLIEFCQENALVIVNTLLQQHKRRLYSTSGHHQMVNTEIRLIIFFAAKDGEALYSQQKQKTLSELTVVQIMNSLLPNWD